MAKDAVDDLTGLRDAIRKRSPRLVAIDGMNGIGKTTTAKRLGLSLVSLDSFLPGDGRYLTGLPIDDIRSTVAALPVPVVVEGCCVLEVLARAGLKPDLHVYIRQLNRAGRWEQDEVAMGEDAEH